MKCIGGRVIFLAVNLRQSHIPSSIWKTDKYFRLHVVYRRYCRVIFLVEYKKQSPSPRNVHVSLTGKRVGMRPN
jgi:hypothetical protein